MFYGLVVLAIFGQVASTELQKQLALSSAEFSQRLYHEVATGKSSVIYSPYSIHSALTMTSLGARDETAIEMRNTLGVTSMGDMVHQTYKEIIEQINSVSDLKLHTGNAIFVSPRYQIAPEFIRETADYYFAKAQNIDFSGNGGPEKPINDYIAKNTEYMIRDALEPGTIDDSTVMLLVNTIFFKGSWQQEFLKNKTNYQEFYLLGGATKQVQMMHDTREINIKIDDANGFDVAELPYKGGRFSLYIALPQRKDGITDLENLLSQTNIDNELFTGLEKAKVELAIPKFKTESTIMLKRALKSLGMVKAFQPMMANFTGISQSDSMYIDQVLHKALIEVDEAGTVAAAATIDNVRQFKAKKVEHLEKFIADHPFVYFLRENQNGLILFQGKFSG